jgi:hypothetical protein
MFPQQPPPPGGKKKKWLIPVLAVLAVLVIGGAAVAAFFMLRAPGFEAGGCVRHVGGDTAEAISCDEAVEGEDYEIVAEVANGEECAEAGRETLTVGESASPDAVYCLVPYGSSGGDADSDDEQTGDDDSDADRTEDEDAEGDEE